MIFRLICPIHRLKQNTLPEIPCHDSVLIFLLGVGLLAVILFSNLNRVFLGCFDPINFMFTVKIDSFRVDLTDFSI